ncbi:MAG: hypothetical protein M3N21_01435 [Actinomycetota bacterium]|nr:hypothetical protein [Actinomycetota bacterium]
MRPSDTLGGLVLMGVRVYNPSTGRFLQTDPVPGGSANSYDYANQDPINQFDLGGQSATRDDGDCSHCSNPRSTSWYPGQPAPRAHGSRWRTFWHVARFAGEAVAGAAVLTLICGASAGVGCAMAAIGGFSAYTSVANYSMDNASTWSYGGAIRAGAFGGAKGALTAGVLGRLIPGRGVFGWGGVGKRVFNFTFRFQRSW